MSGCLGLNACVQCPKIQFSLDLEVCLLIKSQVSNLGQIRVHAINLNLLRLAIVSCFAGWCCGI